MIDYDPVPVSKYFELSLVVRDGLGEPTNRKKDFSTDSPFKLWQFYMRNQSKKPRKKKDSPNLPKK